jgi:hypothetical protein
MLKRNALPVMGLAVVIGMSTAAIAQTRPASKKSAEVTTLGEGEAVMLGPKGQHLHKSNVKVTTAQHEAAMKKGAKEIKPGAVIYKQGGKLYMLEDSVNQRASQNFDNNFDAIPYP